MKWIIVVFCLLFGMSGCREKKRDKDSPHCLGQLAIDFSDTRLKVKKSIFKEFEFVKLETTPDALLSDVLKVVVCNDKFIILSALGGDVMVYDMTGKFHFKIGKGRAPHEIIYPTDIAFSENKQNFYVLDRYRTVKEYDMEGNYLQSIPCKKVALYMEVIGDRFVFFDSNFDPQSDYYGYTQQGEEIKDCFLAKSEGELRSKKNMVYPYPFFKANADTVFVGCLFSDTLYAVCDKGKEVKPFYILDLQGKSMNRSRLFREVTGFGNYFESCKNNKLVSGVTNLVKQGNKLFFTVNEKENYFIVYDLLTHESIYSSRLTEGLPNIYSKAGGNNEYIIYAMTSFRLCNHLKNNPPGSHDSASVVKLRETVTNEEDNPVLLLFKIGK